MPHVLVTGGAGFIGSHLVDSLLRDRFRVTVIDNFDPFYDRALKLANIAQHRDHASWRLIEGDIRDAALLQSVPGDVDVIVHLAAAAGVRPSIADPVRYQDINVGGTRNLLELALARGIRQFVFGSSSSVYGVNPRVPWSEDDEVMPISPYASTKIEGEKLGRVYADAHGIQFIALRLFTVYGPRQRPDLAIHKFTKLMLAGQPIPLFGDGSTQRDYTYVGDIVAGLRAAMGYQRTRFEIVNLGNNHAVSLMELVRELEGVLGLSAVIERRPEQPGDVSQTWASIDKAKRLLGYEPATTFADGLRQFAVWMGAEPARALPRAQ